MKKIIRNVLAGVGVAAVAFTGYVLWNEYTKEQARLHAEEEAKKAKKASGFSPEYIERRRARAAKRAAERAANQNTAAAQVVASNESVAIDTGKKSTTEIITDTVADSAEAIPDTVIVGEINGEKDDEHRTTIS